MRIAVGTMDACHDAKTILMCLYAAADDGSPLSGPLAALTPAEARALAVELIKVAHEVDIENRGVAP